MVELVRYKYSGHDWVTWALGDAIYSCDNCYNFFKSSVAKQNHRRKRNKLSEGGDVCIPCSIELGKRAAVEAGTKFLTNRTSEEKLLHASIGGKASALIENSGRFSTERWNSMSPDHQANQVNHANKKLHEKLNSDPKLKFEHFKKVHAQKGIGYISKGHKELHESIRHLGFKTHTVIDSMEVDECNEELKIIVEYQGDYWHCNPQKYEKDYYNKSIKMTAGEKWRQDIARERILKNLGYSVIYIWESDWKINKEKIMNKIVEVYNEARQKN